jgi:uncharacterized protein YbjT (DUF2867 family)
MATPPAAEVVALGDLRGAGPLDDAVKGVSAVVHLANIPQHPGTPEKDYQDVNVGGTAASSTPPFALASGASST